MKDLNVNWKTIKNIKENIGSKKSYMLHNRIFIGTMPGGGTKERNKRKNKQM